MSYCLNPDCRRPGGNASSAHTCASCGRPLLLQGRYRAVSFLNQGGFGRAFRAIDEDRPSRPACVIKQFFPQDMVATSLDKAAELFHQEAVRLDDLGHHDQIPTLYAHFIQEGYPYLIQEFIDGPTLAKELRDQGVFSVQQVLEVLNNLLPVLQFVHDCHVIHRDVKPENVIRRLADRKLCLVDFGAAKFIQEEAQNRRGTVISSAGFTAPEQMLGRATYASDLYGLGATCVHLLTGRSPLELYDLEQEIWQWRRYLTQSVPEALAQILDRLLVRSPRQRYGEAREVLQDLQVFQPSPTAASALPRPAATPTSPPKLGRVSTGGLKELILNPLSQRQATTPPTEVRPSQIGQPAWQSLCTLAGFQSWGRLVAFAQQQPLLVAASRSGDLLFWEITAGRPVTLQNRPPLHQSGSPLTALAISPDGRYLVTATEDRNLHLWNLDRQRLGNNWGNISFLQRQRHSGPILALSFSPQGAYIASASEDHTIRLWDRHQGRQLHCLNGHTSHVRSLCFSPDGQYLVSGGWDNLWILWDVPQARLLCVVREELRFGDNGFNSVAVSADGQWLATGNENGMIQLWGLPTCDLVHVFKTSESTASPPTSAINCVAFHPQEPLLVSGNQRGDIDLWHVKNHTHQGRIGSHNRAVQALSFSPDGQVLASAGRDPAIFLWSP